MDEWSNQRPIRPGSSEQSNPLTTLAEPSEERRSLPEDSSSRCHTCRWNSGPADVRNKARAAVVYSVAWDRIPPADWFFQHVRGRFLACWVCKPTDFTSLAFRCSTLDRHHDQMLCCEAPAHSQVCQGRLEILRVVEKVLGEIRQ